MNILLGIIFTIFLQVFAADETWGFHLLGIEDIQLPNEQEFKRAYSGFVAENPLPQPNQRLSQLLQSSCAKPISNDLQARIAILLKGFGEAYVSPQEQQVIALYFLNRKKEGENEYYLSETQRRRIAEIIIKYLLDSHIHISEKILEAMLILDTEALRKAKNNYIFKCEGFAISLNCRPHLVSKNDFDKVADSLMAYIFDKNCTDHDRYMRYMQCDMWQYTGLDFEER